MSLATEAEWEKLIKELEETLTFSPSDLGEVQSERLLLISDDLAPKPTVAKLRRERKAITDGAAYHTRYAPPWHVANT